jgi:signal transduction histidine kinase
MLHEFVTTHRDAIIARTKDTRPRPITAGGNAGVLPVDGLDSGISLFLTQLSDRLRAGVTAAPEATSAIGCSAGRHGVDLLLAGYNVSEVVHHYGEICQVLTQLAVEQETTITTSEFHALNGCLDTAIAEAVTEHARITAERSSASEAERLGRAAHEFRNLLNAALLAFQTLQRGSGSVNGAAGMVLGRSLLDLRGMIDSAVADVRMTVGQPRHERIAVPQFIDEVAVVANLHAEFHEMSFAVAPVATDLAVDGDAQLLLAAVMNLLINAFKYTRPGGRVLLRAYAEGSRLLIEVEDMCGGFPDGTRDPFRPFGDQRGPDRTGLGLGLFIARHTIRSHGGDIHIRNLPGRGCVFAVDLALAAPEGRTA